MDVSSSLDGSACLLLSAVDGGLSLRAAATRDVTPLIFL